MNKRWSSDSAVDCRWKLSAEILDQGGEDLAYDNDDDLNVVLFNAGTVGMGHMFPGEGNVSVITAGAGETVTAPQDFGDGTEKHLDAVVSQGGTKVYVECVFPIDDVLCTATTYP